MNIGFAAVAVAVSVMASACIFDWRKREVPDAHWWVLGASGIVFAAVSFGEMRWQYALMLVGTAMILIDILLDVERPSAVSVVFYIIMAASFAVPLFSLPGDPAVRRMMTVPACTVLFYLLFRTGILKGGADAKCLMTMGMMFQTYPSVGIFPLIPLPAENVCLLFPFTAAILFHAALFSFVWLIPCACRRAAAGDRTAFGTAAMYRMKISDARKAHVWAKQDVIEGRTEFVAGIPEEGVYDRLESIGETDVWVTPVIPFMIPIMLALLFVVFAGSLLFIPFS